MEVLNYILVDFFFKTNTNNLFSIKHYKQCLWPQYTWKYTMKTLVNTVYRRANGILNKIYKVPPFKPRVF